LGCQLQHIIQLQFGLYAASPRCAAGFPLPSRSHSAVEYNSALKFSVPALIARKKISFSKMLHEENNEFKNYTDYFIAYHYY